MFLIIRSDARLNMKTNVRHNTSMNAKTVMVMRLLLQVIKLDMVKDPAKAMVERIVNLYQKKFVVKLLCPTVVR